MPTGILFPSENVLNQNNDNTRCDYWSAPRNNASGSTTHPVQAVPADVQGAALTCTEKVPYQNFSVSISPGLSPVVYAPRMKVIHTFVVLFLSVRR